MNLQVTKLTSDSIRDYNKPLIQNTNVLGGLENINSNNPIIELPKIEQEIINNFNEIKENNNESNDRKYIDDQFEQDLKSGKYKSQNINIEDNYEKELNAKPSCSLFGNINPRNEYYSKKTNSQNNGMSYGIFALMGITLLAKLI
jgi:hypothetical protein